MANNSDEIQAKIELEILLHEQARRLSQTDFTAYMQYVNPAYQMMWFHRHIAEMCQKLLDGEITHLMVFVPPQHGKSEIVSRLFPSFALGVNPVLKIIGASYSGDLAQKFSGSIQRYIDSNEYREVFPDTYLNGTPGCDNMKGYTRNADYFETVGKGGFYKAVGVGGSLTGTPADIGIIDDPVKDRKEADSETFRNSTWDWYTDVFLTRLHNDSKQVLIMTRWHEDDLAGRILKSEPGKWTVLMLPAIKENNDYPYDIREIGEALWEQKHSLARHREMEARSGRTFAALYQQRPVINGGNIIKRDWFQIISRSLFESISRNSPIHFFLDTAFTEKKANDPTGIIAACKVGNDIYISKAKKVYMKFPDLIRFIISFTKANGYTYSSTIRIEPKANGISVIDQLIEKTGLNVTKTPTPEDDKATRLNAASPSIECGHVFLVEDVWNEEFMDEICGFPAKAHDEFVDLIGYAENFFLAGVESGLSAEEMADIL